MGKFPQSLYTTDTETDNTSSSAENLKKKKKPSILKYTTTSAKKKKCKIHSISEPEESELRVKSARTRKGQKKLQGILKNSGREKERYSSSSDEEDEQDDVPSMPPDKFLVGRVPLPAGSKPGRGGGVALLVRKSVKTDQFPPKGVEDDLRYFNLDLVF